jgi:hypothetical protein
MGLFSQVFDNNVPVTFILLQRDIPEFLYTYLLIYYHIWLSSVSSLSFVSPIITLSK